jgi:scyllo-inositol 2-dehydrogenase (NADP+)
MKCVIIGLGIQGKKRMAIGGSDIVATVDPVAPLADYKTIEQVPLDTYQAALVCTPDSTKLPILEFLLSNGKHLLVEKPLLAEKPSQLLKLKELASKQKLACYTAYNHRFEPHIVRLKKTLEAGQLGRIYLAKFFYGNGTARDVRNSPWRDKGPGVLSDLGSHLLDWTLFLFGKPETSPQIWSQNCFENKAPDHFHFAFNGKMVLDFEMTLISWRNTFRADVYGELGSAHIDCLCKWGPSTFTLRKRILPSGRPEEEADVISSADPTWKEEYEYFKQLCQSGGTNLDNDIWINGILQQLGTSP